MKKNDEFIDIVTAVGMNGEGIVKRDNLAVFIPFALTGEQVKYKILKVTSKCAYAKLIDVITPAEIRIRPKCPVFTKCGGCQLQHIRYSNQLKMKENNVKRCFQKIANVEPNFKQIVKSDLEFGYRNKLQLPVTFDGERTKIGFYAENSHRVVEISKCYINSDNSEKLIDAFNAYISEFNIQGYDEQNFTGDIREITAREIAGNVIVTVVALKDQLPGVHRLIELLTEKLSCKFSLFLNINNSRTNVIYGDKFQLLYGTNDYGGNMLGLKYRAGVNTFSQINDGVCIKLYSAVRDEAVAGENVTVIDAYSGTGLMTALIGIKAEKVIGVEVVKESVELANILAKNNGLSSRITNYNGKCEELLPDIIRKEKELGREICLVLDPPRKGIERKIIEAIIQCNVEKVIYVSCNPSTLARDVGLLTGSLCYVNDEVRKNDVVERNYEIKYVRPFDMFPQTKHVETLCVLTKN